MIAATLTHCGDLDQAAAIFESEYLAARDRGDEATIPLTLWLLVIIRTWTGAMSEAEGLAAEGLEVAELAEIQAGTAFMTVARGLLRAAQGRESQARNDFAAVRALASRLRLSMPAEYAAAALGGLELSLGHDAAAHAALTPLVDAAVASGMPEPGVCLFVADDVEALTRLGRLQQARELLNLFVSRCDQTGRWRAVAAAARAGALLAAAEGDIAGSDRAIGLALNTVRPRGLPVELGRTLLAAGVLARRRRQRGVARAYFDEAVNVFDGVGSVVWAARSRGELARYAPHRPGGTSDSPAGVLTDTERRIADLAAAGASTPAIASQLFVGARTVETHLAHAYRKLGIRSRAELGRALDGRSSPITPDG
jgi:DNA-binding CsgD family transcriptional regulator